MEKRYTIYMSDVDNGEEDVCDRYLIPNEGEWYYTENHMPVEAPPLYRCGTTFPIWLAGSIPGSADGIVNRMACMAGATSECDATYDVKIKVCTAYSVYFLKPTTGCPQAYCFGIGTIDQPPNSTTQKPVILYYLVKYETRPGNFQDRLEFECNFGQNNTLRYPFYQVTWIVDGHPLITKTASVVNINELRLTEDVKKPGYLKSLGINVSNSTLGLLRSGSVQVQYKLTVPFGCGYNNDNWRACSLDVQMFLPTSDSCKGEITNEDSKHCLMKIEHKDWNKLQNISINYRDRGQYNLPLPSTFVFQLISLSGTHPLWSGYKLPSIQVIIYEEPNQIWQGKVCSSLNDPHMTTFDGRQYENHNDGTFMLYEHHDVSRPMQVQIKLRNCNRPNIFCNCGVAVRAGGDVFVIDFCFEKRIMQFMSCRDGILDVRRNGKNGYNYKIFFPTGTEVEVNLYYSADYEQYNLNVNIRASIHDTENTQGLCGFLSKNCSDDFVLRDKSYSTVNGAKEECRGQPYNSLHPNDFSRSWRVSNAENLFLLKANPEIGVWQYASRYCTCPKLNDTRPPSDFECSPAAVTTCERDKNYKPILTTMCKVLSHKKASSVSYPWKSFAKRRKRVVAEQIDQYKSTPWTAEEAMTYCRNTLGKTAAFTACSDVPNVHTENTLEICALDITLTNSTDWVEETLETMKASCITELQKNDTLHEPETDSGQSFADKITSVVCPGLPECSNHGTCVNGTCICKPEYFDVDCSVNLTQPPELFGIRGEGICDIDEIDCETAYLVFRNGTRLYTGEHIVDASIETVIEVHCPVYSARKFLSSSVDYFVKGHTISVSYNRINFGEELDLFLYDSACQFPDPLAHSTQFRLLNNTCFIEGNCFHHGFNNHTNKCFVCDSSDPYKWTTDAKKIECVSASSSLDINEKNLSWIAGPIVGASVAVAITVSALIIHNWKRAKAEISGQSNFYDGKGANR